MSADQWVAALAITAGIAGVPVWAVMILRAVKDARTERARYEHIR